MNTMEFAFANALGMRAVKTAKALVKAHPLRRKALAVRLCGSAAGVPLDTLTLRERAQAQPVRLDVEERGDGRIAIRIAAVASLTAPSGHVEV